MQKPALAAAFVFGLSLFTATVGTAAADLAILQKHEETEANKALVLKAYQELFGDADLTAIDRHFADVYIQHNPYVGDGREALKEFLRKFGIANWPKRQIKFVRVIAEGDLVVVQTVQPKSDTAPETVIVDIFRVASGKIAEHWDVMQAVPADATNKRKMY